MPTRSRTALTTAAAALMLALPFALFGCSAGTATISSGDFAKQVTTLLEKQVGQTPTVDCGSAAIPLVNGTVVHCDISSATDPTTIYDSTSTISNVNGGDFHIDTKVADQPKS
ncbi:hypothetical protein [Subtercola lobariae]|uniref:DUF4333 domain-containing protein n=1 Tax=Subtercola lobariae TaxID=1588641 RepID=A0A917EXB6_9MICO|nr:hypothetical protein [Subtercola lobariae]GGF25747.1 hypothetical protein GCM10011399_19020 [Subtercola lobariae]